MTIEVEIAGTGQIAEFPDGTSPETIRQALAGVQQPQVQQVTPEPLSPLQTAIGVSDIALTGLAGAGEQVVEGLSSLGGLALGRGAEEAIGGAQALTGAIPDVELGTQGQQIIQDISRRFNAAPEFVKEIVNAVTTLGPAVGESVFQATGSPGLAAAARVVPEALEAATSFGASRGAREVGEQAAESAVRQAQAGRIDQAGQAAQEVLQAGERLDVPVLTTDVVPPTTFLGKFTQQLSEKLGPLGSGTARADQQIARQNVVEELAREFEVELNSPFAQEIVTSLNQKSAKVLADASSQRNRAVSSLDTFGEVPVSKTVAAIDRQIARQERLGEKANQALVNNLNDIKSSIGGDFSLVKDIRTEVIDDLKALARSEDRRAEGSLQSVKSAIDEDMLDFAKANDRTAAADWVASNRKFADEFGRTRNTELKRILAGGEATPEKVLTLLKGGKPSELKRLNSSLTPSGRSSARAAIVRDALDESGFFRGDINPDRLATALNKTNRKQAVDAFFTGQDKKQLDGLVKLLDATRRAQQAAAAPPTGVQTIPLITTGGVGAGIATDAFTTLGAVGTLSAIAKAYESQPFRNLLLKIANSKPGSKQETSLLQTAVPGVLAGSQVASEEQRQREQTSQ